MRSDYFDFFGELLLEVKGRGGRSTEQFRTMYDHFATDVRDPDPDIVVERTTTPPEVETVLGDSNNYYGWTGDHFVVQDGVQFMAVEPGWEHIYVSPDWEPFYAIYPVEFALRHRMIDRGMGLVHASGVELDGATTLFPAWRGAGKTNTLLSILRAGGGFLSDDRLWVGNDGSVQGYPLAVNLQPHNTQSFEEIEEEYDSFGDRVQSEVSQYVDRAVADRMSFPAKAIRFLNSKFLQTDERSFTDVGTLFPQAEYVDTSTVDNVVLLRATPKADTVRVRPLSAERMISAVRAINNYEWNQRLEEYFGAYESLVPEGSILGDLHRVVDAEERLFAELFESVDTYLALIPREPDWSATGIDEEVVDAITELGQREPTRGVE